MLRISMDAKAAVKIGCFSRGGKSRLERKAWDHDFQAPDYFDSLRDSSSPVRRSFDLLHRLKHHKRLHRRCIGAVVAKSPAAISEVDTLVINQDNGPENNSRRTQ